MWHFAEWEHLEYLGYKRLSLDYGVFTWHNENNKLCGIFQSHVADFLWAGNDEFKCNIVKKLCEKFQLGKQSVQAFKYVGLNIVMYNENITLDQIDYISSIQFMQVSRDLQMCKQQICDNEKSAEYRQLIGKLN